ncbi:MAG TPA: outer membrane protein assembly factor BamA [Caulobacteraceae bacterium]|nr:outer membrane protein assembly factor BamA [Caulobacteraceae bacterium]
MDRSTARRPRACVRAVSGLAMLLASTALASGVWAQPTPPPPASPNVQPPPPSTSPTPAAPGPVVPESGVVQRIVVQGNERIETETILAYMPIQVGDTVGAAQIDAAIKTLFKTDLFADVRVELRNGDLIVALVENPIINQVVFEGNSNIKDEKLRDEVQVRPRGIYTKAKVEADVQRIVELYRRSGRISVSVTPQIVALPQKRVDLIFAIDEGPKSGILKIEFLGAKHFSATDLRGVITTKESRLFRFLSTNDNYDPDRIDYDQEELRKFYRNRGYYDFRIVNAIAELAPDKNGFVVTYTLDEGVRYNFGKLKVNTALKKLNGAVLQQLLPIRSGQLYEDEKIEQATDSLTFAAGAAGFAFVEVEPHYTANHATHTVDVTFDVKEGPRVYVERIDVVGNTQTLDYVIRRELLLSEGDAYNRVLVDRSKNDVKALGFFKDVDITQTPGSAPDRTVLQVKVTEQPTGELSFSAGYSSVDKLVTDIGVSERNFRGRGEDVRAELSVGSIRQQLSLSFTQPRFLDRNATAGWDLYAYRYDFTQYAGYTSESIGGDVHVGFPLSPYLSLQLRYSLHADNVQVGASQCGATPTLSPSICDERGVTLTSAPGYTLRWDKRNDPINPTRGFYLSLTQDFAGLGGDLRYVKTVGEGGWYHGFNSDFILSVTSQAGYVGGYGGDDVRINDRFFAGGGNGGGAIFRGFQIAGIGPRDTTPGLGQEALGGNLYAIGTVEETFPDGLPEQYGIHTAAFAQIGTLGILDNADKRISGSLQENPLVRDNLGLRLSAGISVFWKSPLGPIRVDLAAPIVKERFDKTQVFNFSTSTRF